MKTTSIVAFAATLILATAGALADDKASGSAGATKEKSRTAGGVSEDMMKEFRALDANKDGFIAKSELGSKADLAKHFAKADKNRDGKLDPAEYQVLLGEAGKASN